MEKSPIAPPETRLRRARIHGAICGTFHGIVLAPVVAVAIALFAFPLARMSLIVAIDFDEPAELVRAEWGGWPLSPRLAGQAGVEFHPESRTWHLPARLDLEFRVGPEGRIVAWSDYVGRSCALVVHATDSGVHVSNCLTGVAR